MSSSSALRYSADVTGEATRRYATRLNSFASGAHAYWPGLQGKPGTLQLAERAAKVPGLTDLDLNFPDHVSFDTVRETARGLSDLGLQR